MTIRKKMKNILRNEDLTIKELAQKLSEKIVAKINPDSIPEKMKKKKFSEVEEILGTLGYKIEFKKRQ